MACRASLFLSLLIWMLGAGAANAQGGLRQNAAGTYVFSCAAAAPGETKAALYARVSALFREEMMQADYWFTPGAEAADSMLIPLSIPLTGTADMRNQMINCDARIYFKNGQVNLVVSRLVWSGQNAETRKTFHKPLSRLYEMPRDVQLRTLVDADNYLWDLSVKLKATVAGLDDEDKQPIISGFQTVAR